MARFAITPSETPTKKIKERVMELFETADDLKKLFNEILPKNSLLKSILKIDKQTDKKKICDTLLAYLGNNFFYSVGYVKSDDEENNATNKNYTRNLIREKFLEQLCKYQKDNSEKVRKETFPTELSEGASSQKPVGNGIAQEGALPNDANGSARTQNPKGKHRACQYESEFSVRKTHGS